MDIYGNPRNSMDGVSMEFHRMPWSSMEYPWGSITASGNVCACVKFAGKDFVDGKS